MFAREQLIDLELRTSHIEAARKETGELLKFHSELVAGHKAAAERELAQAPAATSEDLLDRARAYVALGENDLARAALDRSIRLAPSVAARLLRASADGGFESPKAEADVEAAAKLAPDDIQPQVWKMHAAEARRDFAAALPLIERLMTEHPQMAGDLLVERAWVEGKLGARAKMDADFSRAEALAGPAALPRGGALRERSQGEVAAEDGSRKLPKGARGDAELDQGASLRGDPAAPARARGGGHGHRRCTGSVHPRRGGVERHLLWPGRRSHRPGPGAGRLRRFAETQAGRRRHLG